MNLLDVAVPALALGIAGWCCSEWIRLALSARRQRRVLDAMRALALAQPLAPATCDLSRPSLNCACVACSATRHAYATLGPVAQVAASLIGTVSAGQRVWIAAPLQVAHPDGTAMRLVLLATHEDVFAQTIHPALVESGDAAVARDPRA